MHKAKMLVRVVVAAATLAAGTLVVQLGTGAPAAAKLPGLVLARRDPPTMTARRSRTPPRSARGSPWSSAAARGSRVPTSDRCGSPR